MPIAAPTKNNGDVLREGCFTVPADHSCLRDRLLWDKVVRVYGNRWLAREETLGYILKSQVWVEELSLPHDKDNEHPWYQEGRRLFVMRGWFTDRPPSQTVVEVADDFIEKILNDDVSNDIKELAKRAD